MLKQTEEIIFKKRLHPMNIDYFKLKSSTRHNDFNF